MVGESQGEVVDRALELVVVEGLQDHPGGEHHGAVGQAATSGWSFASIFIGPLLTFLLFWPVLAKMIRVAKRQNVTSIADFIASRYGKTQSLAAFASLVALVGTLPYIALQLKAVSAAFTVLTAC